MDNIVISSVAEYVDIVCRLNDAMKQKVYGGTTLFRGQPNTENRLLPSLGRIGLNGKVLLAEERNMIEMAKYKLPTVFRKELEPIELLALLQHHGIPTRLLDVSENALVGLYFAVHGKPSTAEKDGEVIVFETTEIEIGNYPMINAICNTYKDRNNLSQEDLRSLYEFCQNPIFAYAPSYSLRQNIQSGRYILFANQIEKTKSGYAMKDEIAPISKEHDMVIGRITVPAEKKEAIRKDLRLLGISKELLFLDNTDMVCGEIRDRYSEK